MWRMKRYEDADTQLGDVSSFMPLRIHDIAEALTTGKRHIHDLQYAYTTFRVHNSNN